MKKRLSMMFIILIGCALLSGTASADWARSFVVNKGSSYTVTDSRMDAKQIGERIGKVTFYSDEEGTYSGNFSNRYPKGTEYYKIIDVDTKEAIAVKEREGQYIKAVYSDQYAAYSRSWQEIWPYIAGFLILAVITVLTIKRLRK
ncbi:hypothetical protein ACFPYJ_11685 [Paenibacillus solisilvae]|uniref:DUF3592 domain-containing protein n=1 Tax=Paenibacillus solisilvae TaxID=2486751 RepID=A0ABW0W050_9BACL